ncbi:MAG TPA: hypothetical protein VF936_06750 [Burkholderiales bacterium]
MPTDALERMLVGEEEIPQPLFTQALGLLLEATAAIEPLPADPACYISGRRISRQ